MITKFVRTLLGKTPPKSADDSADKRDSHVTELEFVPIEDDEDYTEEAVESAPQLLLRDVYENPQTRHRLTIEINSEGITVDDGESHALTVPLDNQEELEKIEQDVRCHIAHKISLLAPLLAREEQHYLLDYTITVLKTLARDQQDRVRRIIAEELKSTPHAPYEVIEQLAWDQNQLVASPVLEYSPLLSDDMLTEIIATSELSWISESIAKRRNISARVSDSIIAQNHDAAIGNLLENESATLSEDGMEIIIDQAPDREQWHHALIHRPELSQRTVNRIAGFISNSLLRQLEDERRLAPSLLQQIRGTVGNRLRDYKLDRERTAEVTTQDLFYHGRLDAERIAEAIAKKDEAFVAHALSLLARFSVEKVRKILTSESPKAVTALAWKAGLSMRDALGLQLKISGIHHTKMLLARDGTEYPLSEKEMAEYLDFFA